MMIVGEKLNSSIPATLSALDARDEAAVIGMIKAQEEAGADYLDINTALCAQGEQEAMLWVTGLAMEHSNCGIMLDSPSPQVIKEAAALIKDRPLIFNSVTLNERYEEVLPLALEYGAGVVGLPIDQNGIPEDAESRTQNALRLVQLITDYGLRQEQIYIDVLAQAVSVGNENALSALQTVEKLKAFCPRVRSICGLSNVSFGLPGRVNINCAFLSAAVYMGLDSAILDITSPAIRKTLAAARAVSGQDDYCLEYIGVIRQMMD